MATHSSVTAPPAHGVLAAGRTIHGDEQHDDCRRYRGWNESSFNYTSSAKTLARRWADEEEYATEPAENGGYPLSEKKWLAGCGNERQLRRLVTVVRRSSALWGHGSAGQYVKRKPLASYASSPRRREYVLKALQMFNFNLSGFITCVSI
ncbi:hypothetical protein MY3296_004838 [Beauveria thailandica]